MSEQPSYLHGSKDKANQRNSIIQEASSLLPGLGGPAIPREIIEETEDVLESIVPCSLVTTALGRSGKMVSEKAGHLPGQT